MQIVTFASDYGSVDGYAAAVKGVIKSIAPAVEIIDVTHELTAISKAAFVLNRYWKDFPKGTIHLVVVDPTVGTSRKALAGYAAGHFFVGPDNGLFSYIILNANKSVWRRIEPANIFTRRLSTTFHGRDIFAPAAAMLANNALIGKFGPLVKNPVCLPLSGPVIMGSKIRGEIIDIDSFGNLIINIPGGKIRHDSTVMMKRKTIPFARTFADLPVGTPMAYIGSMGYLEIAVNSGRADRYFKVSVGARVTVIS